MNVILLTIDCLRADRVGFMGYEGETTPFLDELAKEGVVFESAFATGPTTTQSMPGLMTGTYPSWFGGYPPIPKEQPTLAETFSDAGYKTAGIHSNPWLHPSHRFDAGFDIYINISQEYRQGSNFEPINEKTKSGSRINRATKRMFRVFKSMFYKLPPSSRRIISQGYFMHHYFFDRVRNKAETAVDQAIDILDRIGEEKFFLWVHFMDTHRPYTLTSAEGSNDIWQTARVTQPAYTNPTPVDQGHISSIYDRNLSYVDSQIERLFRKLKQEGEDRNTLFVVTSDHGEEFGEHGDWFHRNFKLYDELLHVPLVVAKPTLSNSRYSGLVSLSDVSPSVLEIAGINVPTLFSGQSFADVLWDENVNEREAVVSEVFDPNRDKFSIRSNKWKLIRNRLENDFEIYDLESDPNERNDLSCQMDIPEIIQEYITHYLRQRKSTDEIEINSEIKEQLKGLGYLN